MKLLHVIVFSLGLSSHVWNPWIHTISRYFQRIIDSPRMWPGWEGSEFILGPTRQRHHVAGARLAPGAHFPNHTADGDVLEGDEHLNNFWATFEHHWTSLTPEWSTGYTITTFSHRMCSVFLHLLPRGNCFKPWGGIGVPWGTLFSDFFRHTRMEGMRLYIQELIQLPMSKPVETI